MSIGVTVQSVPITVTVQDQAPITVAVSALPGATGPQGPAGPGVPTGGLTGQVLVKTSNADYATGWSSDTDPFIGGSGTAGKLPKFTGTNAIGDSVMSEDTGRIGIGASSFLAAGNLLQIQGTGTGTIQADVQNLSNGNSASSDLVATADNGTDTTNFIDMGINSSTYNDANYTSGGPDDSYILANGGNLAVISGTTGKIVQFFTGGTLLANLRESIRDTGTQSVNLVMTPQTQVNSQVIPTGYSAIAQTRYQITGSQSLTIQGTGILAVR